MNDLADRTVLVTGGTSGIGEAVVRLLSERGARVAILTDAPQGTIDEAIAAGHAVCGERVDISDAGAVASVVDRLREICGPIGALVNNAGVWQPNPVLDSDIALFDRHIDVNLKGSFYVTRAVLPDMIAAGSGDIVFIGSVSGTAGRAGDSAYSASKAGVVMLARTLATELGPQGVRINCVNPGAVATPLTAELRTPEGQKAIAVLMEGHPSPRREFFIDPASIAEIVHFLLTSRSSALHGAVIAADEGLTATL